MAPPKILSLQILLCFLITKHIAVGQIITSPEFGTLIGSTIKSAWTSKTIYQFLGVKYAESPSGKLRFKVVKLTSISINKN